MKKVIFLSLIAILINPVIAGAVLIEPKFSIDPASPAIDGNITPDDVLKAGPVIHTQGTSLGLQDNFFSGVFDNLDALSYGQDPIINPLYFSVDRVAVGLPGSAVFLQAQPGVEEAHGDVYKTLPPFGSNRLFIDEEDLGLTPGFFGDDLDALELDTQPSPYTYFSIDLLSAANGFGAGDLANDILVSDGSGVFSVYAPHQLMGLQVGDDLDALVLIDIKVRDQFLKARIDDDKAPFGNQINATVLWVNRSGHNNSGTRKKKPIHDGSDAVDAILGHDKLGVVRSTATSTDTDKIVRGIIEVQGDILPKGLAFDKREA